MKELEKIEVEDGQYDKEILRQEVRCSRCNALLSKVSLHIFDPAALKGLIKIGVETKCHRGGCKELTTKIYVV